MVGGYSSASGIVIAVVLAMLVGAAGSAHAQSDEFQVVMDAAIANNGVIPPDKQRNALKLYGDLTDGVDATTPLVLDLRTRSEYIAGHVPGAINIYYRHLGKRDALDYLNSSLQSHVAAGKMDRIVSYGNTHHYKAIALYLSTQGYPIKNLKYGFAEWTKNGTVAPTRFIECDSFDSLGKGTSPANCTSNNFATTTSNAIDAATQSGKGYPTFDCIPGNNATSADLAEITRCVYDARFGNLSKPDFRMDARELYDLLDDNQDGTINGSGDDSSNDPYVLSNRGAEWADPCPSGAYYTLGHIPGAIGIDYCNTVATNRTELQILNNTDFMPRDKLIVHHCWVGQSQQYGASWYNLLGYTAVSLDYGMNGWSDSGVVRESIIEPPGNPNYWYPYDYAYDPGDNQLPHVVLKSPSDGGNVATTTVTFSIFVLEGGRPNVTLWGNWSGWHANETYNFPENYTGENTTEYNFTVTGFLIGESYEWYVNVTDESGNSSWTAIRTFNIIEDTFPPNVTISAPANGSYVSNSTPTLTAAMAEDNPDTMWYSVDGGSNTTGCSSCASKTFEATLTNSSGGPLLDGLHNVTVYANDTGGFNGSNISFFTVDTTDPTRPALVSPANNIISADTTPDLNWTNVTDVNFANYTIQVDNSNAFDSIDYTYNTTNINETNYSVTGAWIEDTWYWQVVAWDRAGNSNTSDPYTLPFGYGNFSINITADEIIIVDALSEAGTVLDMVTSDDVNGGSINITRRSWAPANSLNSANGLISEEYSVEKYVTINASENIRGNLSWVMLKVYYNTSDLDQNDDGTLGTGDINKNLLRLYWYDSANGSWHRLTAGANYTEYGGPYVINAGVTTTPESGYLGYVWANVTSLSVYVAAGPLIPAPVIPRVTGGGGPPPPKTVFAHAILTTSEDWHYAMMAAGFAAAHNYILIATPTHSIDLLTRNNIKWFDELIIIGDRFVMSDGMEDKFVELRRTLVPGFANLNTTRVKGANFFDTAVQLAKQWKDPKGMIVVRGDFFSDALVAGQLSAATDSPILYTMPGEMWSSTLEVIESKGLDVTIVGGEKAVSKDVEDAIRATGVNVRRIGGKDRYETAALVGDEYIKAAKKKGKSIDTITFLSGKKGEWASTLGLRSYVYNSTILYVNEVEGQSAVPAYTKDFIAAHPYISSASIVINNGAKPKGYEDVDAYVRDMQFEVDQEVHTWEMDVDIDKKDYALDTNTKGLSIAASQEVRASLEKLGIIYKAPASAGGGGGDDGDGS